MKFGKGLPGPRAKKQQDSFPIIAFVVCLLIIFYGAYRLGTSFQSSDKSPGGLSEVKTRITTVQKLVRQCTENTTRLLKELDDGTEAMQHIESVNDLDAESKSLQTQIDELDGKEAECSVKLSTEEAEWAKKMKDQQAKYDELEAQAKLLRQKKERLEKGKELSQDAIMLNIVLEKLAYEHLKLLKELGMTAAKMDEDYFNDLMHDWSSQTSEFRRRLGEVLPAKEDETWSNYTNPVVFNRTLHKKDAVFEHRRVEGTANYTKPSWLNYEGNRPMIKGVHIGRSPPLMAIPEAIRTLYEYSLCAMGQKIDRLGFPNKFHYIKDSNATTRMSRLVVTPFISFCSDCKLQHGTGIFKLLCKGYSTREHYGTVKFWTMRSRIVPSDEVMAVVDRYTAEHKFGEKKTLAVRLARSAKMEKRCQRYPFNFLPIMAYTKLLKDRVPELSTDTNERCYQPLSQVVTSVKKIMTSGEFKQVYFSCDCTEEEKTRLQKELASFHVLPFVGSTDIDIMADLVIASRANGTVINRYDASSTHITEYFILNHDMRRANIWVW